MFTVQYLNHQQEKLVDMTCETKDLLELLRRHLVSARGEINIEIQSEGESLLVKGFLD